MEEQTHNDKLFKRNEVFPAPEPSSLPVPPGHVPPEAPAQMPVPHRPPGCPPGLEYLIQIDQLLVHQKVELAEVILGWEMNNKYVVKNSIGQQVFFVAEENNCCNRICCGPIRSFVLHVQDNFGQEVITLTRPLSVVSICDQVPRSPVGSFRQMEPVFTMKCLAWGTMGPSSSTPLFIQLEVQAPPGNPIGFIVQDWHLYLPKFTILNERKEPVLKIVGPFCQCKCCSDVNFEVISLDETANVGRISKQWTGALREMYTDADNFGINFPMDLDVKIKAVLLGACFLIDFMFFEHNNNNS